MNILLVRNGDKALFLPAALAPQDCPVAVTRWLGAPISQELTELNAYTAMPGIDPQAVLDEISKAGFYAIDAAGILRAAYRKRSSMVNIGACKR
ncbi:hypothetical protein [Cupriavidus pauculus]|uniref:hypothetical protein n=1 Tax=Cupriavidus pauculus TaxID=82633 RepID=UPI0012FE4A9D|nr:hypothetical protein [Cupriavidus pauculus]